jgi:monoamine oxidase
MAMREVDIAVIGGGAAGIAAARRLCDGGVDCVLLEARPRLGGRAWTIETGAGFPVDLGCGWLHSADRNAWAAVARTQARSIDRTPPPWRRHSLPIGFPLAEQADFLDALGAFFDRVGSLAENEPDRPAAALLEPRGRWNPLIDAVSTYISGVELSRVSARDLGRYDDSGVNWRVIEGYGAVIAAHGAMLPAVLGCPVRQIDRRGRRLRVETAQGTIEAHAAVVAVPSAILADGTLGFTPALPEKMEAAAALPLGLADKLFLSLAGAEEFEPENRLFGRTDTSATPFYHLRPFGRPLIEAYFGGNLADELEAAGEAAFFEFAVGELTGLLGSAFARRVTFAGLHRWRADRFARGSYSYALPGKADCRAALADPVEDRLFFAGEACARSDFSTAHGAYRTGIAAAEQALVALRR